MGPDFGLFNKLSKIFKQKYLKIRDDPVLSSCVEGQVSPFLNGFRTDSVTSLTSVSWSGSGKDLPSRVSRVGLSGSGRGSPFPSRVVV